LSKQLDLRKRWLWHCSDPGDNLDLTRSTPIWAWWNGEGRWNRGASADQGVRVLGEWLMLMKSHLCLRATPVPKEPGAYAKSREKIRRLFCQKGVAWLNVPNAAFGVVEGLSSWYNRNFPTA